MFNGMYFYNAREADRKLWAGMSIVLGKLVDAGIMEPGEFEKLFPASLAAIDQESKAAGAAELKEPQN